MTKHHCHWPFCAHNPKNKLIDQFSISMRNLFPVFTPGNRMASNTHLWNFREMSGKKNVVSDEKIYTLFSFEQLAICRCIWQYYDLWVLKFFLRLCKTKKKNMLCILKKQNIGAYIIDIDSFSNLMANVSIFIFPFWCSHLSKFVSHGAIELHFR